MWNRKKEDLLIKKIDKVFANSIEELDFFKLQLVEYFAMEDTNTYSLNLMKLHELEFVDFLEWYSHLDYNHGCMTVGRCNTLVNFVFDLNIKFARDDKY